MCLALARWRRFSLLVLGNKRRATASLKLEWKMLLLLVMIELGVSARRHGGVVTHGPGGAVLE